MNVRMKPRQAISPLAMRFAEGLRTKIEAMGHTKDAGLLSKPAHMQNMTLLSLKGEPFVSVNQIDKSLDFATSMTLIM